MSTNGGGGSHGFGVSGAKKGNSGSKTKISKYAAQGILNGPSVRKINNKTKLAKLVESEYGKAFSKAAEKHHVSSISDETRRMMINSDINFYKKNKKRNEMR